MIVCASCGHENSDAARFCEACGAALGGASGEHRKVVTVLFCDVVGSTALGESMDPEALRGLLARYFERMRAIVEAHEAQATVHALRGEPVEAERLAREAISLIGGSDDAIFQPDAWFTLGEILALARKTDEAETALEEALGRYEQKGQPRDGRPHSTTAGRAPGGGATMSVPIVPVRSCKLAIVIEATSVERPSRPRPEEATILATV